MSSYVLIFTAAIKLADLCTENMPCMGVFPEHCLPDDLPVPSDLVLLLHVPATNVTFCQLGLLKGIKSSC